MAAALQDVKDGMGVREASRLYNLPYETLRRRVAENVDLECRPGPPTVLTENEETELASYCVKMADMGFGLSRTDVMVVAFKIVEASGRKHPFTDGAAGRAWFDGFRSRHPRLTLRSTQSLSRARASSGNSEIISDFFAKLNAKANYITDAEVLEDLKRQKEEKAAKEREKEKRRQERERKKKEKQEEKERKKQEREKKKEDRQKKKDQKQPQRQTISNSRKTCASVLVPELRQSFSELNIGSTDSGEESEAECPECGLVYGSAQDEEQWVQCDNCAAWWDMTCAGVDENIADSTFVCSNCM